MDKTIDWKMGRQVGRFVERWGRLVREGVSTRVGKHYLHIIVVFFLVDMLLLLLLTLGQQTEILFLVYAFIGYGNVNVTLSISMSIDFRTFEVTVTIAVRLMQPQHTILVCSLQETINKKLLTQVLPVSTTIATSASVSQSSKTYEQNKELF
uniref:Uncharacterized protein n=1 Tax=Glossina palpalis gambiensis TaxID=67801 RepID=A0A1B0AU32_9MUSC